MIKRFYSLSLLMPLSLFAFVACEEAYVPKPKGYNRIDLPEFSYQVLPDTFPYRFVYSKYAQLSRDSFPSAQRYYINLYYPDFDGLLQITYKDLTRPDIDVERLLTDAFELTMKHNVRAYSIEESILQIKNGQRASVAELTGEVPSQFQFFTTDTSRHFFRGALYFNTAQKNDSLAPVIEFIKQDVIEMLNSFEWKY